MEIITTIYNYVESFFIKESIPLFLSVYTTILILLYLFKIKKLFKRKKQTNIERVNLISSTLPPKQNKYKKKPKIVEEEEINLNLNELINQFLKYVKNKKLVKVGDLSGKFGSNNEEKMNKLRDMEKHGQTYGFMDKNGQYFNLNMKEIELLEKLITNKGKKIKKSVLMEEFNNIVNSHTLKY